METLGDGLRSSPTWHDDAAGDCLAFGCMCKVGLPVGDRRAAILVDVAGVGGLACTARFRVDDRRAATSVGVAVLVDGRARAGVCVAVMRASIAGFVSGRACEG